MAKQPDLLAGGVADVSVRHAFTDPTDRTALLLRGLDALDVARLGEAETLALVVSRCLAPGADPAAAAAALLERFGCVGRVVGASAPDLAQVIGADAAAELVLLHPPLVRSLEYPMQRRSVLSSWSAVQAYLRARLAAQTCSKRRILLRYFWCEPTEERVQVFRRSPEGCNDAAATLASVSPSPERPRPWATSW